MNQSNRNRSRRISYIVWRQGRHDAVVIDPGFDTQSILERLALHGLTLAAILNTHGHVDHIAGNEAIKNAFPEAPLFIGRNEAFLLRDPEANMSAPFGLPIASPEADRLVDDGERIEFAGFDASRFARSPDTAPARSSLFATISIRRLFLEATCFSPARSAGPISAATCRNCCRAFAPSCFHFPITP